MNFDEDRMDNIGRNGNDGLHYDAGFFCGRESPEQCNVTGCLIHTDQAPQGVKCDHHKPMMDLIPPLMELEVARVLTFGAVKYGPENWRHVPDMRRRYLAAAKRHINALQQDIMCDDETGLHHAAHAVCCLMFLGEVELEVKTD